MPGKGLFRVDAPGEYSSINISKAKQKYSFPKGTRFPQIKGSYCETAAYEPTVSAFDKQKATSFGYGNRFDKKLSDSPEPGRYESKFNYDSRKKREPSFGFGGIRNNVSGSLAPGPGSYEPFPTFGKEAKKLSFGNRTGSLYNLGKENPGPGTYEYNYNKNFRRVYCIIANAQMNLFEILISKHYSFFFAIYKTL